MVEKIGKICYIISEEEIAMKKITEKQRKFNISKIQKANRLLEKRNKRKIKKPKNIGINEENNKRDSLVKFLNKKKFTKKVRGIQKNGKFIVPEIFSFSQNPEETLMKLKKLCFILNNKETRRLYIDHSKCKYLGISASAVMDAIITEYKNNNKRLGAEGKLSEEESVNNVIKYSGIMKHLNIEVEQDSNIEVLPWMKDIDETKSSNSVVDYLLRCLNKQGFTLKEDGTHYLLEMVSEIVQNCKYHAGENATWYILGHASMLPSNQQEVQITIFNFGNTIYESYLQKDTSKDMLERLNELSKQYKKTCRQEPDEEMLWTIYSLKDKVSRYWVKKTNEIDQRYSNSRGSGMMSLIRNLYSIGFSSEDKYKPIMCILSGKIHILFDGDIDYKKLSFNSQDSIYYPPEKYVKKLSNYFPGTIISMKFYLDSKYLRRLVNERQKTN